MAFSGIGQMGLDIIYTCDHLRGIFLFVCCIQLLLRFLIARLSLYQVKISAYTTWTFLMNTWFFSLTEMVSPKYVPSNYPLMIASRYTLHFLHICAYMHILLFSTHSGFCFNVYEYIIAWKNRNIFLKEF